ncbi:MAG: TIGR01777 family oxidoreductase [Cyclobacteriaceae bacterium]
MPNKILITGGSGLVGNHLSKLLVEAGHQVAHLSRSVSGSEPFPTFKWDIRKGEIDEAAFDGVTHIVHLAGAGVADKKWTPERKKVILDSRIKSTELLFAYASKLDLNLKSYISASAIGLYPYNDEVWAYEQTDPGDGFLPDVVKEWEKSADLFQGVASVAKVRIGVVLSPEGGAMAEIVKPIKMFVGAPLGSGQQVMSWIHIHDLAGIFQFIIEEEIQGVFNATAPNPATNAELTRCIARALQKPLILPNVPAFVMKMMLGEMAEIVLKGCKVSPAKILTAGFNFEFPELDNAVKNLLGKN